MKAAERTDSMDTPKEASHPFQRLVIFQFRGATAMLWKNSETKSLKIMQRCSLQHQRGYDRNFALGQFVHERVFLENGAVRPASRAIQFCDDWGTIFEADLVDSVLVAVECQQPAVAAETEAFQSVQHALRGKRGEINWSRIIRHSHIDHPNEGF